MDEAARLANAEVSMVIVCDHLDSSARSWADERAMLRACAQQDFGEAFEILLVDQERWRTETPSDLGVIAPNLRLVFTDGDQSALMKDAGVRAASTPWVAVFEADSVPEPAWLSTMMETARREPAAAVISSRTRYPDRSMVQRVMSLFHRGLVDAGREGWCRQYTNSGALFQRATYLLYDHEPAATPFVSARDRIRKMAADGRRFYFQPEATMIHAYEGWHFVADLHRSQGYADMLTYTARQPSYWKIPRLIARRVRGDIRRMRRVGPQFIRWYDWPLAILGAGGLRALEIPGMVDAVRGRARPGGTGYR